MNWNSRENEDLIEALLSLRGREEMRCFLHDLLTEKEIIEFAKRFRAAQMLTENIQYAVIEGESGLGSTTITRVSKWFNGKGGGYRSVIARMHHHPVALSRGD